MRLRTLIDNINYVELVNMDNMSDEIMGISYNSKKTAPNDLFICLTGEHVDGHEYAEEAFDNGAIAFVVERRLNLDAPQIVLKIQVKLLLRFQTFSSVHHLKNSTL